MTLALGLGATFIGAVLVLAGYSDRPIGRLLFGYWDAPGSNSIASAPVGKAGAPAHAASGGVYAPAPRPTVASKYIPVGGPR